MKWNIWDLKTFLEQETKDSYEKLLLGKYQNNEPSNNLILKGKYKNSHYKDSDAFNCMKSVK